MNEPTSNPHPTYYYNAQLATYIIQVMAVFQMLKVKTGKQADGEEHFIDLPVQYGSKDRVSVAILGDNTQNLPMRVPCMSAYLTSIKQSPDRRKFVGQEHAESFVPRGALLPDGVQVIHRYMPIPYIATIEFSIYSSNTYQRFQILEQILILFDPDLQIQRSDAEFDWTKITIIQMNDDMRFEENYPSLTDRRMIIDTFSVNVPIYISPPVKFRQDYIKQIWIRLAGLGEIIQGGENAAHEILNELNDAGATYQLYETVEDLDVK
jgi:hypothetical protein